MLTEDLKTGADIFSLSIVGASLLEWIPAVSALVSIIWVIIRIMETRTVRRCLKRWYG